jgi:quercetin dioxygenase-like cupin family protein
LVCCQTKVKHDDSIDRIQYAGTRFDNHKIRESAMRLLPITVLIAIFLSLDSPWQQRTDNTPDTNTAQEALMSSQKLHKTANHGPSNVKLEFENESVQVLRVRMGPHEKTQMHDITPRLVVWLTDANLRIRLADGEVSEEHGKSGGISWVPAQRHAGENLSDQPLEFLAIVPKQSAAPARNTFSH